MRNKTKRICPKLTMIHFVIGILIVCGIWLLIQTEMTRSFSEKYVTNSSLSDLTKLFGSKESQTVAQIGSLIRVETDGLKSYISRENENISNLLTAIISTDNSVGENVDKMNQKLNELLRLSTTNVAELIEQLKTTINNNRREEVSETLCFNPKDCPKPVCEDDEFECAPCGNNHPLKIPDNPIGIFYLVVGPESSGNKYTVSMLKSAGCDCESGHSQPWDVPGSQFEKINTKKLLSRKPKCAAMHRSFPHDKHWVNIRSIMNYIVEAGYEPRIIYITRNILAVAESQVRVHQPKNQRIAMLNIERAKREIYGYIANSHVWFREFIYEQYGSTKYLEYVYKELGYKGEDLIPQNHRPFSNKNVKYNLDS